MNPKPMLSLFVFATCIAHGQGTFVYDQQSSDENSPAESVAGIQANQPIGQSFTPALSSIGFIRLQLFDLNPGNGLGASVYVNLRTSSITGPIIGSTDLVFLPDGFFAPNVVGFTNFFFSVPVSVAPNSTYYFQPVVQSGDVIILGRLIPGSDYAGGTEFIQGQPGFDDVWFREGIVVPEPSAALLGLLGAGLVALAWRRRKVL